MARVEVAQRAVRDKRLVPTAFCVEILELSLAEGEAVYVGRVFRGVRDFFGCGLWLGLSEDSAVGEAEKGEDVVEVEAEDVGGAKSDLGIVDEDIDDYYEQEDDEIA